MHKNPFPEEGRRPKAAPPLSEHDVVHTYRLMCIIWHPWFHDIYFLEKLLSHAMQNIVMAHAMFRKSVDNDILRVLSAWTTNTVMGLA